MAKGYIVKLRRGTKETDANGNVTRDDWAEYTEKDPIEAIPQAGELVLEYDNGIPRLKIGDGEHKFADLPYMSVDSFILPKQISVTLYGSEDTNNADKPQWTEETDAEGHFLGRYKQLVTVNNAVITANSKVDLQPTSNQLSVFHQKDITFVAENEDGIVTVFCIGQKPTGTYTIPVTITEIVINNEEGVTTNA